MISKKSELILFTQYERDIDKFKPSCSGFVVGLYRDEDVWRIKELKEMLTYMKKHPIKSVYYCGEEINGVWEYEVPSIKILKDYIYWWYYNLKTNLKEFLKFKKCYNATKRLLNKLGAFNYVFIDNGEGCYPRFQLKLRRKDNCNIEDYEKEVILIDEFDDKYFNDVSIELYEVFLDDIQTNKDVAKDNRLKEKFETIINEYFLKDELDGVIAVKYIKGE